MVLSASQNLFPMHPVRFRGIGEVTDRAGKVEEGPEAVAVYRVGDQLNHNSIIRAMRIANVPSANKAVYRHNDMDHLDECLRTVPAGIERVMVIPGMNVVLVLGIILGFMGHYPILGFIQGGQQNWLLASNILLISVLLVIITIFLPRNKRLEPILQNAVA